MDITITARRYDIRFDDGWNRLIQGGNPDARPAAAREIKASLRRPSQSFRYTLNERQLGDLARKYGEQYVSKPYEDVSNWFDIVNGRLNRPELASLFVLSYFFVKKQGYSGNISALSTLGEAVAGYWAEQQEYKFLLRPVGMMPDAILCKGGGEKQPISFALVESKASASRKETPNSMIQKKGFEFLDHVRSRVIGLPNDYEAFLVCSCFHDIKDVESSILSVDLRGFKGAGPNVPSSVKCSDIVNDAVEAEPRERVKSLLRLNESLGEVRDRNLVELLRSEAKKSGWLALLSDGSEVDDPGEVDKYLEKAADELGLRESWDSARELASRATAAEDEMIERALKRYRSPELPSE